MSARRISMGLVSARSKKRSAKTLPLRCQSLFSALAMRIARPCRPRVAAWRLFTSTIRCTWFESTV
jgi:hypothetical protein